MATTSNFGWETPDDTDLVKDGASAMRTLGSAIDTSMGDLKGGTSGQILSKNSGTDMDFTWVDANPGDITAVTAGTGISGGGTSGSVTITNSMATAIDAKGDLIVGSGADAFARLGVGTDGQVLTADSASTNGIKWNTAASGGMTLLSTTTLSGSSTTISSISQSYKNLYVIVSGISTTSGFPQFFYCKPNNTADAYGVGPNYDNSISVYQSTGIVFGGNNLEAFGTYTTSEFAFTIADYASTTNVKAINMYGIYVGRYNHLQPAWFNGGYNSTSAVSSLVFNYDSNTAMASGTVKVYGVN